MAKHEEVAALVGIKSASERLEFAAALAVREGCRRKKSSCGNCGKHIKPRQHNQQFCSTRCRVASHRAYHARAS